MRQSTLDRIAPLLRILRANSALHEVRPAVFQLHGHDFLHFHDEADGVVADVRLARSFVRMPVSTSEEQSELLERIDHCMAALDSHARDRKRRAGKRHRRPKHGAGRDER